MKIFRVNEKGRAMVALYLRAHHVDGHAIADSPRMLSAWLNDIELHAENGNGAYLEIPAARSVSGRTEIYTLPELGIDDISPIDGPLAGE